MDLGQREHPRIGLIANVLLFLMTTERSEKPFDDIRELLSTNVMYLRSVHQNTFAPVIIAHSNFELPIARIQLNYFIHGACFTFPST